MSNFSIGKPETDIRDLVPQDKYDFLRTQLVIDLGYPAVAPIIPELLEWLQDCNWPISGMIGSFLSTLGSSIVPDIQRILTTNDPIWKNWVLSRVVAHNSQMAIALKAELINISTQTTIDEDQFELKQTALEILSRIQNQ